MSDASEQADARPLIVGMGGSTGAHSSTNQLLQQALAHVAARGARTQAFAGDVLGRVPIYSTELVETQSHEEVTREFVDAVRAADCVIIATPGYHGGMSGLVKNALDHLEALRDDARPYLDGRAVGVIVGAAGWQACGTALVSVRSAVHSLRGWPTPFGVTVNTVEQKPGADGTFDDVVDGALQILADQLVQFARWQSASATAR
ncbi:NADPH-dependent FMN reductase [uncultured Jatrophihabitans sp.]|uniref:NADPH-dependent FMN reductase n=1 Tax=uncultured Jatrophihabitans sp. TaxID=1610747 RepID=UPI0035CA5433